MAQTVGFWTGVALEVVGEVIGLALLAGFVAAAVALTYRWYVRERVPSGLGLLAGLSAIALQLATTSMLAAEIETGGTEVAVLSALVNIGTFLVGAGAASAGTRAGDRLGMDLFEGRGATNVDADVSEIVQTIGRVTAIQLPPEIDDVVGYDPTSETTKEKLAGRRFLFPRRLTRAEVKERLVSRLKTDYGVGHVDLELDGDGTITYLAVGARAAGIGPTLPPATNAVAIHADPAHAASSGDLVQVWETEPLRRVLTGELRGVAGDVVTVAIDAADTPRLDPTTEYKLVTLPVQERPGREFASLLRAADETMATITVTAGSRLDGAPVGNLDVTVAAITGDDASPEPLPAAGRTLEAGDVLYVVARPEDIRRLETAASERAPTDRAASRSATGGTATPGTPEPDDRDGSREDGRGRPADGPVQPDDEPERTDDESERTDDERSDHEERRTDDERQHDQAPSEPPVSDASPGAVDEESDTRSGSPSTGAEGSSETVQPDETPAADDGSPGEQAEDHESAQAPAAEDLSLPIDGLDESGSESDGGTGAGGRLPSGEPGDTSDGPVGGRGVGEGDDGSFPEDALGDVLDAGDDTEWETIADPSDEVDEDGGESDDEAADTDEDADTDEEGNESSGPDR